MSWLKLTITKQESNTTKAHPIRELRAEDIAAVLVKVHPDNDHDTVHVYCTLDKEPALKLEERASQDPNVLTAMQLLELAKATIG